MGAAIAQGLNSAVRLFGAITRPLTELVHQNTPQVGLAFPANALLAWMDVRRRAKPPRSLQDTDHSATARHLTSESTQGWDVARWTRELEELPSREEQTTMLDLVATAAGPRIMIFVDDSIGCQGSLRGLHILCRSMDAFLQRWQLALATGKKGPRVLAIEAPNPGVDLKMGGTQVRVVEDDDAIPVLGSWIDPLLSFAPALRKTTAQVREEARRNFAALQGNGFGLPMQVRAWQSRVESSILPGTEVLSSAVGSRGAHGGNEEP